MGEGEKKDITWVAVDGLIGSGKSTLLDLLKRSFSDEYAVILVPEPVHLWIQHGILARVWNEPFASQCFFFHTRIRVINDALKDLPRQQKVLLITERSPHTDFHVFWKVMCNTNPHVTPVDRLVYPLLWSMWTSLLPSEIQSGPHKFIFLNASVELAQSRMRERNREEEQDKVTYEYQRQLLGAHTDYYSTAGVNMASDGMVIDASLNYRDDPDVAQELVQRIKAFISSY